MPADRLEIVVGREPLDVRAYAHPNGRSISISVNAAKGVVWRSLVDVETGLERADAGNDRALLATALKVELRRIRMWFGAGGMAVGILIGRLLP